MLVSVLVLAGCGSDGSSKGEVESESLPSDLCAEQHTAKEDGRDVVVCEALHEEAPFVHLPADTKSRVFAELDADGFVTSDDTRYSYEPTQAEEESEGLRHGLALYAVDLKDGKVSGFHPAVMFDDRVFLAPLLGQALEGKISRRIGPEPTFEEEPSLRTRLKMADETVEATEPGFYAVDATFANLGKGVRSALGDCIPDLLSFGEESPFADGVTISWSAQRVPSMHLFGDDQFVFVLRENDQETGGSLMGPSFYRGPMDAVRGELAPEGTYDGIGHGSPGSNPVVQLEHAEEGGATCTPR